MRLFAHGNLNDQYDIVIQNDLSECTIFENVMLRDFPVKNIDQVEPHAPGVSQRRLAILKPKFGNILGFRTSLRVFDRLISNSRSF